jgi:hypothetical protein
MADLDEIIAQAVAQALAAAQADTGTAEPKAPAKAKAKRPTAKAFIRARIAKPSTGKGAVPTYVSASAQAGSSTAPKGLHGNVMFRSGATDPRDYATLAEWHVAMAEHYRSQIPA